MQNLEKFNSVLKEKFAVEDVLDQVDTYETSAGYYYAAYDPTHNICFIEAQPHFDSSKRRTHRAEEMRDLQAMVLSDHPGVAIIINYDSLGIKTLDLDTHAMNDLRQLTYEAQAIFVVSEDNNLIMKWAVNLSRFLANDNVFSYSGQDSTEHALQHLFALRLASVSQKTDE